MYVSRIQITHIANSGLNSKTAFHTAYICQSTNDDAVTNPSPYYNATCMYCYDALSHCCVRNTPTSL